VSYGWARPLDDSCEILRPGERRRARVVCLMTRAGETAGYLRDNSTILVREPPTVGRVVDLMRRCFGLPTPPPELPSDVLLAHMWLNNVLSRASRAPRLLAWREVALAHPVLEVAAAGGVVVPAAQYPRIMEVGAGIWDWRYLLTQAAAPGWLADLLPEGAGGWMDEGIFARWLLAAIPGADQLLDRIVPLIEPTAAKRLRSTLTRLGADFRHPLIGDAPNTY
jgi:hypothetical protein